VEPESPSRRTWPCCAAESDFQRNQLPIQPQWRYLDDSHFQRDKLLIRSQLSVDWDAQAWSISALTIWPCKGATTSLPSCWYDIVRLFVKLEKLNVDSSFAVQPDAVSIAIYFNNVFKRQRERFF
jgi:hypothetical protein